MHARSPCLLCQSHYGSLHIILCRHHQICQLVHDYHYLRHHRQAFFFGYRIVSLQIPYRMCGEFIVPPVHLHYAPVQGTGCLLRISHHRCHQVRDAVIDGKLHHLGVYHHKLHFIGSGLIQYAHYYGIDTYRLTCSRGSRYEHMRHLRDIEYHGLSGYILTYCKGDLRSCVTELIGHYEIVQHHRHCLGIGHLYAYGALARYGSLYPDALCRKRKLQVICQAHYPGNLHSRLREHLISCDRGTLAHISHRDIDPEALESVLKLLRYLSLLLLCIARSLFPRMQQARIRQTVIRYRTVLHCHTVGKCGGCHLPLS